ncbi:23S rRNA (uracil(1939)-C(5))-methyltransferase RlmD [uncultured Phocaeicola sp.]|uniref:23S rRNA (uracil(1939)-C(5))-methyltransferase RlmD n=1 Tax=uncultured Phocaeicola sp. TaxID=990718 RepID=UPI001434B761|nr:23S rRNA (uracil(1939)-C(5))-methyltransferase RlmD [uncultured Phocaeicola sp.]GFH98893.1 23S rRNA (uracil-C(5))-methyltransferase RlmCD [Bacteroidaceae bacterium]
MARKKKELPLLEKIAITDVAAEGKALAKVNDLVVFVPYVVPGDVVDLQVKRKKNHYAEAVAVKFHEYSPVRAVPFCQHYGVCGGCKWQCLPYAEQIKYKQKQVADNLTRIGKIELPEILPILGSEKTEFYRNKLEFTFSNKRWLTEEEVKEDVKYDQMNAVGFHIPGAFDKVLAIEKCWLQDDISNQIRNAIRDYAYEHNYSFFNLRSQEGMLRNLMIRTSSTGELMVLLQCKIVEKGELDLMKCLLDFVAERFSQITSLLYVVNNKCNDTINDLDVMVFKGNDHIFEEMEGLRFKIGAKSFYQTNSGQAYNLYKVARNFAGLTGNELVYDLYTGTGTIANFVSRQAKKVIGIEYVPEAIEDAKVNSAINGIDNTLFYAGDMKDILTQEFITQHGRPDVIITDPPRAGMHDDVINTILFAEPQRIVYVSCNPATQARDLSLLDVKYKVMAVQPVDMFPHTHHVENVVLLEKRV